jgi:L,D-transpeptidase ErfK/SrfK
MWVCGAHAQELPQLADRLGGGEFEYAIKRGDSFSSIGARYGVEPAVLAATNALKIGARLKPGQVLRIDNRHIVPTELNDGILINLPQRMLFFFRNRELVRDYPVGLGRPTWPTPRGGFQVLELREHPTWHVPKSIQHEMAMEGKVVKEEVPPGPDNPLGDYFIRLGTRPYGIHGTIAPLTIYGFRTHGCIRLHPDDAAELFHLVKIGQSGLIIYASVLLARLGDGRIFLEVHRDVYKKGMDAMQTIRGLADFSNISDAIDWTAAQGVADRREGLARDITARDHAIMKGVK